MRKELGRQGEERAARYLRKKGYKILDRNYYTRYGELDIVCEYKREIIFVEVKTRKSLKYGTPEEAITYRKMNHIKKAALIYLNEKEQAYVGIRFDVLTIIVDEKNKKLLINHIENAF